jgi:hypothetical protein
MGNSSRKTRMPIRMWTEKTAHEISDGMEDSFGNWTEAIHVTLWQ